MGWGVYHKIDRRRPNPNAVCDIYCMKDPETNEIMYIGCTSNLKNRILAHRFTPWRATKKEQWIKLLNEKGGKPKFEVIKTIKGRELALKEERKLIVLFDPPLNSVL